MKKFFTILFLCLICFFCFVGCDVQTVEKLNTTNESMFVEVENTKEWRVVYHKQTMVMYVVSDYSNSSGVFTVLLDENGNPLLWSNK